MLYVWHFICIIVVAVLIGLVIIVTAQSWYLYYKFWFSSMIIEEDGYKHMKIRLGKVK